MKSHTDLAKLFIEKFSASPDWNTEPQNLYSPCSYFLQLGGKRLRPVLCLMAAELFGEISDDVWHAAKAIELFHNFTLVHDDIMDNAPLRRGQPTLHEKYGLTAGILCGDMLCIAAYEELGYIKNNLPPVLRLFSKTAREVCEGQQMDMDFQSLSNVSSEDYIRMITLKTSVLVAAALKMGALLGGATEGNADKLYAFGLNMGIAFQLMDDYLDAFGDPAKTGKQPGGDILEGKQTYLLIHARNDEAQKLKEAMAIRDNAEKVKAVQKQFKHSGADAALKAVIKIYASKAAKALDEVAVRDWSKQHLRSLASELLLREF